jgi:predicted transcriptional regulator
MKRERMKVLNYIIELLEQRGEMTEEEVLREAMSETWLSRQTVKKYIDDLVFIGRIERNSNKLRLPSRKVAK